MDKAVIFDMDGVLIDSEPYYFERRMDFFKAKGIQPGSDKFEDYVGNSEKQTWKVYLEYKKHHGIDFQKALRSSVPQVLTKLSEKGLSIGLASSSPRKEINQMLSDCQLEKYFSFTISGEEVKESKPNPEIYTISRKMLNCPDCLAVEDSTLGIASAKAAGIYTVALKQAFLMDQREADVVINELEEL